MRKRLMAAVLLFLCAVPRFGYAEEIPGAYRSRSKTLTGTFATVSTLCVFDDFDDPEAGERFSRLWEETKAVLNEMDALLSVSVESSEISRFNALPGGGSMPISPLTADVFQKCQEMYRFTDGCFDPTILPLVDLWGFSTRFRDRGGAGKMPYDRPRADGGFPMPDKKYMDAFLCLVGLDGIALEDSGETGWILHKNTPDVVVDGVSYQARIDLGGIAKGYAVDRVVRLMKEAGVEYGYFSCGSSSISLFKSASFSAKETGDPSFSLDVRAPRAAGQPGEPYASIRVKDQSLSSSGDYENAYRTDGYLCSHIISPFTGYPLNVKPGQLQQGICTVTLLSGSAVEDDALTTALCLMGPEKAAEFYREHLSDRDILMVVYQDGAETYGVMTNLKEDRLQLRNDAYYLARDLSASE